jgi:hypothetical protein
MSFTVLQCSLAPELHRPCIVLESLLHGLRIHAVVFDVVSNLLRTWRHNFGEAGEYSSHYASTGEWEGWAKGAGGVYNVSARYVVDNHLSVLTAQRFLFFLPGVIIGNLQTLSILSHISIYLRDFFGAPDLNRSGLRRIPPTHAPSSA